MIRLLITMILVEYTTFATNQNHDRQALRLIKIMIDLGSTNHNLFTSLTLIKLRPCIVVVHSCSKGKCVPFGRSAVQSCAEIRESNLTNLGKPLLTVMGLLCYNYGRLGTVSGRQSPPVPHLISGLQSEYQNCSKFVKKHLQYLV